MIDLLIKLENIILASDARHTYQDSNLRRAVNKVKDQDRDTKTEWLGQCKVTGGGEPSSGPRQES